MTALALLAGCAQQPARQAGGVSVVVVPSSSDGHVGAVVVRPNRGGKPVLVDKAYVEANVGSDGQVQTAQVGERSVRREFAEVRAALPRPPVTFVVLFVEGTDTLQPEARSSMDKVAAEIRKRAAPEIAVIGHTDYVGSDEYNDRLSLQRAEKVRDLLVKRGIDPAIISVAGRGKRDPVVASTGVEPQNRRVEITVR